MATIVHRRPAPVAPAPPRGPGASLSALTWIGWVSVLLVLGWILVAIQPLLALGDIRGWDWGEVLGIVWGSGLRSAALLALPAALEWGLPGARYRTPWLMRGAILLALEVVARAAISVADDVVFDAGTFGEFGDFFSSPAWLALNTLRLGAAVIGIAGVWALSDGLADAGARIDRRAVVVAAVAGALLASWFLPFYVVSSDLELVGGPLGLWLALAGGALGAVDSALWMVVAVRLVAGQRRRLRPGRGWAIGGLAGAALVASTVLYAVLGVVPFPELGWAWTVLAGLALAPSILLALAFAAGLGRGRTRRDDRPRRVPGFSRTRAGTRAPRRS